MKVEDNAVEVDDDKHDDDSLFLFKLHIVSM